MVYIFYADGTEEIEFTTVLDVLRRAGVDVVSVSADKESALGTGAHGITICTDITADETDADECDMVIVPGGVPGVDNIAAEQACIDLIKNTYASGKTVAAICAGPTVLAKADVLKGKKATAYPGFEDSLDAAGAVYVDEKVVVDGNVITSQGPGTAMDFAFALVENLKGRETADKVKGDMLIY